MTASKKAKGGKDRRKPTGRGAGALSLDPDTGKVICDRLRAGESIATICSGPGMPNMMAFYDAAARDPALRRSIARARDAARNDLRHDIIGIAGSGDAKLRVLASRLRAEKLLRKGTSKKIQQDGHVSNHGPTPEFVEMARRLGEMERFKRMTIEHQPKKDEEE